MDQSASFDTNDMEVEQISKRSDAEETERRDTQVSDSGYSHSCTNSQSQRSSSKSRDSSSGGSSVYEGNNGVGNEGAAQTKRTKDKDRKRKSKSSGKKIEDVQPKEEGDQPMDTSPHPDDGLQTAILSQTLSSMKKIKNFDVLSDKSLGSPDCTPEVLIDPEELQRGRELIEENVELKIVVSMEDGNVVYTSGLVDVLGYPNEMWFGRSLVEFIQPKHRVTFACHITTAIANQRPGTPLNGPKTFFCCLRIYKGLKVLGFNSNKTIPFLPFQLSFDFQELTPVGQTARKEFLVIKAKPVRSAYNYPSETKVSRKFMTRHSANCQFIHLDPEVMPYFGYIPQDLLGKSVLDLYHPEDLHFLKEVYQAVMKEQGHLFRSKPYRFRCQNGDYALVETELSSFINPWSKELEFVIGQHSVLRGPRNPDVVTPVAVLEPLQISAELLKETKIVQEEIKCLLNESQVRTSETVKQQVTKRCKDLAVFMENLMDEMSKPPNLKIEVPTEEQSFSERDSVMLGEISPHHDYYDSKSSSGTPPSYNQLNYNENIQRFFESKPKTSPSDDWPKTENPSGENEEKESPVVDSSIASKSGSGTGTDPSTGSHANSAETTASSNTSEETNVPTLTEQLLSRHNEDMEKQMVQKHKGMRKNDFKIKERLKDKVHELSKAFPEESAAHGVKRCGSQSWDGEPFKLIKSNPDFNSTPNSMQADSSLWPPIAVPLPMPFNRENSSKNALMPMYYMTNRNQKPLYTHQLQYVPLFHPVMFGTPPVVYSPVTVYPPVYQNVDQPQGTVDQHPSTSRYPNTLGSESSSLYSFLKTDKSDNSWKSCSVSDKPDESADWPLKEKPPPIRKVAPWMEGITVTPELIYNYRLEEKSIQEILKNDMDRLEMYRQPSLVNEQLSQLYVDFELEGLSRQLTLEESPTSSDSSDERPSTCSSQKRKRQRNRFMEYDKMTIHFEEDAPMPPPLSA